MYRYIIIACNEYIPNYIIYIQQGKSERFDSCDRPNNLTQIGLKLSIIQPVWPWNLMDDLQKLYCAYSTLHQALCIISNPSMNSNWSYGPEMHNSSQSRWFFVPCYIEIWRMTLKNNRAPLLCYIKHCASFQTHWWIQTSVTVRNCWIQVKIDDFFSRVTSEFYGWRWKTIGHLFYATSSFVHHLVAIGEFKLELQSGYAQSRSNSTILRAVWSWNLTDDLEKQ